MYWQFIENKKKHIQVTELGVNVHKLGATVCKFAVVLSLFLTKKHQQKLWNMCQISLKVKFFSSYISPSLPPYPRPPFPGQPPWQLPVLPLRSNTPTRPSLRSITATRPTLRSNTANRPTHRSNTPTKPTLRSNTATRTSLRSITATRPSLITDFEIPWLLAAKRWNEMQFWKDLCIHL